MRRNRREYNRIFYNGSNWRFRCSNSRRGRKFFKEAKITGDVNFACGGIVTFVSFLLSSIDEK